MYGRRFKYSGYSTIYRKTEWAQKLSWTTTWNSPSLGSRKLFSAKAALLEKSSGWSSHRKSPLPITEHKNPNMSNFWKSILLWGLSCFKEKVALQLHTLLIFLPVWSAALSRHTVKTLGTQWTVTLLEAVAFFSHLETKQNQVLKCTQYSPNKARQAFVSHISLQYFKAIPCHEVTLKKNCVSWLCFKFPWEDDSAQSHAALSHGIKC